MEMDADSELSKRKQHTRVQEVLREWPNEPEIANSVCAIVVAYHPENDVAEKIRTLLPQVSFVVVVDNTPTEERTISFSHLFKETNLVHTLENSSNRGISAALNQGLRYAAEIKCGWVLTLDQDTECYPGMVRTLFEISTASAAAPKIIGGNYVDPRNRQEKVVAEGVGEYLEQKTVISSGSLINTEMANSIGGFREDYFIDQVDHEFCLRARMHGHKVVISRKPVMNHCVGASGGVRLPFLGVMPNHAPARKYYIARNTIVTVAEYWRQEPEWCLRRLARLLLGFGFMVLLEKQRFRKARAFFLGVRDALIGRMGPYPGIPNDSSSRTAP